MCILLSLDEYQTGHAEIDRQHYFLCELANGIFQAHRKPTAMRLGNMFFRYLNNYFITEENIMRPYNYPGFAMHVEEHKQLMSKLRQVMLCSESGLWVPSDFIDFTRTQLMVHIVETDMKLC